MSIFHGKVEKWIRRYLFTAGIALIGVPLWEFFVEEWIFEEVDLFFPGDCDVIVGGIHIAILAAFHLASKRFSHQESAKINGR